MIPYIKPFFKPVEMITKEGVHYTVYKDHVEVTKVSKNDSIAYTLEIKSHILGRKVTVICNRAFRYSSSIKTIAGKVDEKTSIYDWMRTGGF